jgi:hypothetical protein
MLLMKTVLALMLMPVASVLVMQQSQQGPQ